MDMKDFQRFEVRRCQVFKIWDNHKQEYWKNGPEDENDECFEKIKKSCDEMNALLDNLKDFNPNKGLGRPRKRPY